MTKQVYRYVYVIFGVVFVEVLLVFVVVVLCVYVLFLYLSLPKQENSYMKQTETKTTKKAKPIFVIRQTSDERNSRECSSRDDIYIKKIFIDSLLTLYGKYESERRLLY